MQHWPEFSGLMIIVYLQFIFQIIQFALLYTIDQLYYLQKHHIYIYIYINAHTYTQNNILLKFSHDPNL